MLGTSDTADESSSIVRDLKVLDGIASWCGALHGSMPLDEALAALSQSIGADLSVLSRDIEAVGKCRIIAQYDHRHSERDVEPLRRAYAPNVLGKYVGKLQRGSSWFLSDHQDEIEDDNHSVLSSWRLARGVVDIAVVSLESSSLQQDHLEFHFAHDLSRNDKEELEGLLSILVRAWSGRKTGLVTQAQIDERILHARAVAKANKVKPNAPLLGTSNPAKLSRAEFRVCLLLSRGLSVKGVIDELGLSEATVRSHLRSIYSKTEVKGLPELVYRLLSGGNDVQTPGFGRA